MDKDRTYGKTITIIGGGPSGMMAAISAARQGGSTVRILEKNEFLGRKLLATGNGRCNLTNMNCPDSEDTLRFFAEIGLLTREESEGRVYPYSEQASSVQEILINTLNSLKVEILSSFDVQTIERTNSDFIISNEKKLFYSDTVILATGGKAGPQYGSTGDGYRFAKTFGHTIVRPMPSLVQMVSDQSFFKGLKGVRAKGQVELLRLNEAVDREIGEIQFTDDGLSGICIFNLSKKYVAGDMIRIDLLPDYSEEAVKELLSGRMRSLEGRSMTEFLNGMLHKKLIPVLLNEMAIDRNKQAGSLSQREIMKMAQLLKGWKISIIGTKGWKEAQVTSGGVELSEIDIDTMGSKLVPELYFAGELLNFDGKCGGFNLQWAWMSGFIAGKAAAIALREKIC